MHVCEASDIPMTNKHRMAHATVPHHLAQGATNQASRAIDQAPYK